jgi:dipeptidyl aminopeptidase/acylaminoacyl peptidase
LLNDVNSRLGILFTPADGSADRDLAWLNASFLDSLSDDAEEILFLELQNGEGRNPGIYLRKTDGSPAVRLGYGNRPALSHDGKRVACIRQEPAGSRLMILPTGPGDSRTLDFGNMHYESVEWFPDGHRILFTANEPGHPVRSWTYDLNSSGIPPTPTLNNGGPAPFAITPEGIRATAVSPDQRRVVRVEGRRLFLATPESPGTPDGSSAAPLTALEEGERVARWSADGRYLYFRKTHGDMIQIARFEVATRRRELWHTLRVPEQGASFFGAAAISADGKAYAASFQQDLANLYLVRGLK